MAGLLTEPPGPTVGLHERSSSVEVEIILSLEQGDLRSANRGSVRRPATTAWSLIHFLRDQGQPQSEWLAALSADQTLSEPVRQRALQFAREWKP